ncbi:hypothetical protein H257_08235 [Aphanomyces astaci]|uniref:Uncharacterized protein n=1 Tax=Aphanomyces astaci TaxID=112090 RepID=W4GGC5_APHAT|nr:hypothetical protein H257_08235 [Aphanomyces astaci]ETV78018.1 hypothetical protein H257_08235 [Aphanomyces astaci]|eukprot:XP_009832355.1 hypothetical protein H257_08235 [Aphanomyces astaci]
MKDAMRGDFSRKPPRLPLPVMKRTPAIHRLGHDMDPSSAGTISSQFYGELTVPMKRIVHILV